MESDRVVPVCGAPGYRVSSSGSIWGPRGRVLSPVDNRRGYKYVHIRGHKAYVHRIVAYAFLPGGSPDKEVDHINGNRSDNRVENLRWVTHRENHNSVYTHLRRVERMNAPAEKDKYRRLLSDRWLADRENMVASLRKRYPESLRRDVLWRRDILGLSYKEIGADLGISPKLAANLYHREKRR